jgi:hypothetical protein
MSTILNSLSRTASLRNSQPAEETTAVRNSPSRMGVRGLSVMLLAAAVSTLVMLADEYVSVWTDGHLFFGWVVLWAMIFAGMALFAGTARTLATRALGGLDVWSQSLAQSRAEARMWDIAKSDPRIMAELVVARSRTAEEQADSDFDAALAPMGFDSTTAEPEVAGWGRFPERLAASRAHRMHLYYI